MTWSTEDGGPRRLQWVNGARLAIAAGETLQVASRSMMVVTMVVVASSDEIFVLCHTGGDDAVSWVERVDPETLETLATSEQLAGGPAWPGGIAVHPNGDMYVVFGNHAHRLNRSLQVVASRELPRVRPYNSFVLLPDGHLVTKDFGGSRPGIEMEEPFAPTQLVVLEPTSLNIVATLDLPDCRPTKTTSTSSALRRCGECAGMVCHLCGTSFALGIAYLTAKHSAGMW